MQIVKNIIVVIVLSALMISCKQDAERITGVYVRSIDHEFAIGQDTLIIKSVHAPTHQIEKRSRYQRILKGKLQAAESHRTKWTGIYDKVNHLIRENVQGKVLVLSEDGKTLLLGALEYRKIE